MKYPNQRIWQDSRVLSITEGTYEIRHMIIAGELKLGPGITAVDDFRKHLRPELRGVLIILGNLEDFRHFR